MRQIVQNLKNGNTAVVNVPCPEAKQGSVLISSGKSLVSAGTERMLVNFAKASLLEKARSQPDKVKQVLEKIAADGLSATLDAVATKLDQPLALGYCNVGTVLDGSDTGFSAGTRVVSNGNHAEVVRVPKNLVAKVPDGVDDETASFTVVGAIALQGVRLASPGVGESVVVLGLGLIGLLAVQILKAAGCRVLGVDFDAVRCGLAKKFGAEVVDLSADEDPVAAARVFSRGRGVDSVLITASSTSNDIVHQAATMCRKRGKIVLIGTVGLHLNRSDFYEKELSFQVSCSYGPGRYDPDYEDNGHDYPIGYVRWTEQRNFEAVLDLMNAGAIDTSSLVSHRYEIDDALLAYQALQHSTSLGIVLSYEVSGSDSIMGSSVNLEPSRSRALGAPTVSFIGAGNYASRILIPAFIKADANLACLVTSGGLSAVHHGNKNGFALATTDITSAFGNDTDAVVIATQHNLHAPQVLQALKAGKHVFVEKPLALKLDEIDEIELTQKQSNKLLMVGYNRRFSPIVKKLKSEIDRKIAPKSVIMTMSAGAIPKEHWTQNSKIGGGRIVGEACHYIDLMRFLIGSPISAYHAVKMEANAYGEANDDIAIITLRFEDGSIGSIHYFANGGKSFPKERVEVFCDDGVLQLDNFRQLKGFGWRGFRKFKVIRQNKGQAECVRAFVETLRDGGVCPIPQDEIYEVARVTVEIAKLLDARQ